ncbi:enoyl-CoA hydratase/isomerase family protein [Rhodococcoides yunnanense]|uniref:Enoyl-CoA hydratase/isomerase family protein n=1 Tax=Rhodococcoides yunnanense TaxID=278209 RepID=A0ABU4BKD7_9NOCA|nr:enoyl-CoA hydratase/isomerase family protein [Rhodococcus yunnanensis]MDV6264645.1 enoyl-CoA hydratase/isomerase family protein [Rhodococcus yunnanensis]
MADRATLSLTETQTHDPRFVTVDSITNTLGLLAERIHQHPLAADICDDVLRANYAHSDVFAAVATESLAYSTLQAGPDFQRWLAVQSPRDITHVDDPVLIDRAGDTLGIRLNQPDRHNAFSNTLRSGLLDALRLAEIDHKIARVELRGNGKSFCSGGDLKEFGTFDNPAAAHLARTRYSPALHLARLGDRLREGLFAHVHGATLGSGLEMAACCGHVAADPLTVFRLPELDLGLIPGAGGTVSIPRRIGRWRTAYLVLTGESVDAETALEWGLIDSIRPRDVEVADPTRTLGL